MLRNFERGVSVVSPNFERYQEVPLHLLFSHYGFIHDQALSLIVRRYLRVCVAAQWASNILFLPLWLDMFLF